MAARGSGYSPFSGDAGVAQTGAGVAGAANGSGGGAAPGAAVGGSLLAVLEGHTRSVRALALAPDSGDVYTAGNDGAVLCWSGEDLRLMGAWLGHAGGVLCLALSGGGSPASTLYSGGEDGCVRGWERAAPGGEAVCTLRATGGGSVHALAAQPGAPDGAADGPRAPLLASAHNDGCVRLWRPAAGEACIALLLGHTGPVFGLALSPRDPSALFSASHDGTGRCWRLDAAAVPREGATAPLAPAQVGAACVLRGHANGLTEALAVSADGGALFTAANDGDVRKWDARSGAALGTLSGHTRSVTCLALSEDASALYSGAADGTVRAWRAMDGSLVRVLSGHKGAVYALALSPGGGMLYSGAYDDCVRGWATADGACICTLRGHANLVRALRLAPDGATLFSASADNTVRAWRVPLLPPLPRLGRAPAGPYDPAAAPPSEEEALAAAMGQLGAFVPPGNRFATSAQGDAPAQRTHSPADGFTLKPGRDGRARPHMMAAAGGAGAQPVAAPAAAAPASPPLPASRPALLQPRVSPPAARPPPSPKEAAAAVAVSSPPKPLSPLPPKSPSPPPVPVPAGLPAFAPPPGVPRSASSDALLGGTLRPRTGGPSASPEGRRGPLPLRPAEGGATAFGSAGYAGAAAAPSYLPPSADTYVPSPGAAQYSAPAAADEAASTDDFAARVAAARASGVAFVPIVTTVGAANAEGFTAADSPRAAPAGAAEAEAEAEAEGDGNATAEKAVAEGNGCSQGDFVARIARARSSGGLSNASVGSVGE